MLVSKSIPNLINGISQQPASLRLPTQAERQENLYSSVVEGLMDRPPTEYLAKIYSGTIGDAFTHVINRDVTERYMVMIKNGDLFVHTLAGVQKTVNFPNGKTYLNGATPSTTIKAVTVADYTFIVNTTTATALKADLTTTRLKDALIFVKQGAYGSDYRIFIDGTQRAIKTTSTTVVTDIATDVIAEKLRSDLATWAGANYNVSRYGSVVYLQKVTGDFKINCTDAQGGASLAVFKESVQSFTSLPTTAPTDYQIAILGQPESSADDYYVKFAPATSGETFGEGHWEETLGQNIKYKIDPATMPHILVRELDGTFTFKEAQWNDRTVGDDNTAPAPSFVDQTINEVFFFKNRLHFLSKDGVLASEVAQYFNFWRTTVTTVLDSDAIDYTVSHTKAITLRHAVPFDEKALLMSDQTQFILQGGQTYTQKTITVDATTEVENSLVCKPVASDKRVYFATPNEGFHGVREYHVDKTTGIKDAVDVSAHVPKYIPAGAFKFFSSGTQTIVGLLTTGDTPALYVYKYFYAGDDKLQSSWSRMSLGNNSTIVLGGDFIEAVLYLAVQRIDGVYLEKMNFSPGLSDPTVNYVTHYDRRITEANCVSVVFAAGETTWTLPYQIDGTMKVVTRGTNCGQLIPLTYQSGSTIKASGDHTAKNVYIGQTYTRTYRFSHIYMREQGADGKAIILEGRLQIRTLTIAFSDTGTFTVNVTPDYRDPNAYTQYRDPSDTTFTGRVLGAGSNLLGAVALATGKITVPVLSKNDQVTIEVTTDSFLPMHLLSADWEGLFHARARRV